MQFDPIRSQNGPVSILKKALERGRVPTGWGTLSPRPPRIFWPKRSARFGLLMAVLLVRMRHAAFDRR